MFSFIFFSPQSTHITFSFNLFVTFTFRPLPAVEINNLGVSLEKLLILDRYELLEAHVFLF